MANSTQTAEVKQTDSGKTAYVCAKHGKAFLSLRLVNSHEKANDCRTSAFRIYEVA